MFEQQHKLETFLMKDLTAMLSLVVQLPPSQRPEKEEELKIYLENFQKEMEVVERDIRDSIDHDLNVKMRRRLRSLRINNKSALKAKYHSFRALLL